MPGFDGLTPPGVIVVEATGADRSAPLTPAEEPAIDRAVENRQAEFRAGRACAHRALDRLGAPTLDLPRGDDRAPVWPDGVVGAITHCDGFCAAAVARTSDFSGVGIDAEVAERVTPEILGRISNEAERDMIERLPPELATYAPAALFGVKESIHKTIHPRTGVMLAFTDVELALEGSTGSADAVQRVVITDLSERARAVIGRASVELRVRFDDPWVLSVVTQGPGEPRSHT